MEKCEKSMKFVEAELAKQKIIHLKKVEEEKIVQETKSNHEEYLAILKHNQKEELDRFNEIWDKDFYEMSNKFAQQENNLKLEQEKEMEIRINEFNSNFPEFPKPSSELLDLNKRLELLVKIKDYPNAHLIQVKINEISITEKQKFLDEKNVKLNREIERMRTKHDNEINALQTKMNSTYGEFKKDRAIAFETLLMKYKNKLKETENQHKIEIHNITKKKGMSNNTSLNLSKSRISSQSYSNKK